MAISITRPGADIAGVAASGNVASYSNVDIGAAALDRIVVVCVGTELTSSVPTSCTVNYGTGGPQVTTPATSATLGAVNSHIFYVRAPTGTLATVDVTFGSTNPTGAQNHIAVYRVTGAGLPITGSNGVGDTDADPISSGAITIPTGGGCIAVCSDAANATARTWTGITEDLDVDSTAFRFSTGTSTTAGTPTITVSGGNAEDGALSWILFGLNNTLTPTKYVNFSQFPHTASLAHFDGTDASTTFTDEAGRTWTAVADAQLDTAQFKFGTSSLLLDGTGDYITGDSNSRFSFFYGDGDFTVDFWVRFNSIAGQQHLFETTGTGSATETSFTIYKTVTDDFIRFFTNGANQISGSTAVITGQWYHIALTRAQNVTRLFLDGVVQGIEYTDTANYIIGSADRPMVGSFNGSPGTSTPDGWIDELRVVKNRALWTANFTPPTAAAVAEPAISVSAGVSNLQPSLYSDPDTFRTHTVTPGAVTLAPSLYSDPDTFGTHKITLGLLANIYSDPDTFYNHTITTGAVNLSPSLFSDADTFRTHVLSTTVNLTASLYTNANTFYTHTLTATYSLLPSLYSDADSFYTHAITTTYSLLPSHYLNVNVLYPPAITSGGGGQDLTPSLYSDPDIFYTHTITTGAVNLAPSLFSDADTFYTHTITTGAVNLAPSLFTNTNTFYSHTVTTLSSLFPSLYSNANTFYQHTITTGAVNLAPNLYLDPDTFGQHTITQGVLLQPGLFLNTNVFYQHTITTGAVNLAPGLFSDADTFYQHTITTTYALSPNLFTDADTFYTHTITATYNLLVGLYEDADQLYPPTITQAGGTFNLDVPLLENQNQFYQHTLTGGQQGPQEGFGGPGPTAIRFSREDWRRLKKKWEEAARAQEAVERKAKEVTGKRREALAAAARAAEDAILEADEQQTPPEGADTLTRLLRAAVAAKSLSDTVTAANKARDYAHVIEAAMEEEEAVALLMLQ